MLYGIFLVLFFFFQAEDGIRDGHVTGVQTCALPLAEYGVVVSSGYNEGGTWSGAIEQIERLKLVPIFVRDGETVPEGNKRLLKQGALPFPAQPWTTALKDELARLAESSSRAPIQQ